MPKFGRNTPDYRSGKGCSIRAFHATDRASAEAILRDGFRLDTLHKSDPGDFGLGAYFTTNIRRAWAIGRVILEVRLKLKKPMVLTDEEAYNFVLDTLGFDTIHGHGDPESRTHEAWKAREWFLSNGYDALVSVRGIMGGVVRREDLEIAVYDLSAIRGVTVRRVLKRRRRAE